MILWTRTKEILLIVMQEPQSRLWICYTEKPLRRSMWAPAYLYGVSRDLAIAREYCMQLIRISHACYGNRWFPVHFNIGMVERDFHLIPCPAVGNEDIGFDEPRPNLVELPHVTIRAHGNGS